MHLLGAGETERGGRFADQGRRARSDAARVRSSGAPLPARDRHAPGARTAARCTRVSPRCSGGPDGTSKRAGRTSRPPKPPSPAPRSRSSAPPRRSSSPRVASTRAGRCFAASSRARASTSPARRRRSWPRWSRPRPPCRRSSFSSRSADAEDVPAADRARIDAMHVGALGLASVDVVLSASLQARQLVEAIRAGDRARTVRAAVIYYGSHLATRGGPVSAHERDVHALIERLVERGGSAEELAFSRGTYGVGLYMRGRWREAMEVIDAAYAEPAEPTGEHAVAGGGVRRVLPGVSGAPRRASPAHGATAGRRGAARRPLHAGAC